MRRTSLMWLAVMVFLVPELFAQSPAPQTYTITAEAAGPAGPMPITIYRDGPRERVEMTMRARTMTTLYDFQAHTMYWIGWSGPNTCSAGRYLSARAPLAEDPITGAADSVAKLAAGRKHTLLRPEAVNGIAARLEQIAGPRPPKSRRGWPTRVWIAQQGDFIVKVEGFDDDGRPATLFEIKRLSLVKPPSALLVPPADCVMTNSEMDDSGLMRAHGESSSEVQASGTVDLSSGATQSEVTATSRTDATKQPSSSTAKLTAVKLEAVQVPYDGPCGRKLEVTGTLTTDGPATVWYRFYANVAGVTFQGQDGTIELEGGGDAMMTKDVTFTMNKRGEIRLQAAIQGLGGRHGAVTISNVVPFQVTCTTPVPGKR